MSTLIESPRYNYILNDLVQIRVSAHNSFGWGLTSLTPLTTGALIRTVPSKMTNPTDHVALTNSNSITV
jgi:hypothetical protein